MVEFKPDGALPLPAGLGYGGDWNQVLVVYILDLKPQVVRNNIKDALRRNHFFLVVEI